MLEATIENRLQLLQSWGFKQLKLQTPGTAGTKDRLILQPKWSPAPPIFVEFKKPGKIERALQIAVRDDWRARGCDVRDMCDTVEKVKQLCSILLSEAVGRYIECFTSTNALPEHIYTSYMQARTIIKDMK